MKTIRKAVALALALALCMGLFIMPAHAANTGMTYFYNETVATAENELMASSITPGDGLDATQGTHRLEGSSLTSRYASAFVWTTRKNPAETKPLVDSNGTEYYVGETPARMLGAGCYLDDYYWEGQHYYTPEGEYTFARWGTVQQFVLTDALSNQSTTAYCVDQVTSTKDGTYYDIENLEDADYFTAAQANAIRTVALNGYWGQPSGTGSLAAMKAMLAASGEFTDEELARLTDGVAMSATQYAIWHFSNANDGTKHIGSYWFGTDGVTRLTDEQKPSMDLIFKIYYYLIGLDPSTVANTTANTVITEDNFLTGLGITNAVAIEEHPNNLDTDDTNDAYTADLSFTMAVLPSTANGDDLVAEVVDANGNVLAVGRVVGEKQDGEIELATNGAGTYTFQGLELVEGTQQLSIQLNGHQELKQGVYLYNPVGGRSTSQTLLGIAEGSHEVDIALDWDLKFSVDEEEERVIHILKKTGDGKPLEGIQFDFYFAAGRDEYLSGDVTLPDAEDYTYGGVPDYTIVTDTNGEGTFNLTENHLPDGVYLVVEREHPAIVEPVKPFYVIIPATSADGSTLEYVVNVYPKNTVRGNVVIEKDVLSLGNDWGTVNAYEDHTWIIGTTIPADIGLGKSFVISDTLDNRLDFIGNVKVQVENTAGTVVAAVLNERDYVLTVNDVDSLGEGTPSDSFTVSLTRSGMEKVASVLTTGITHIRVYFDAQINANAEMGEEIPNQATLDYTNSVNFGFHVESDIPEVVTGGTGLLKVDANNNSKTLAGAAFQVYRIATEADMADESIEKVDIDGINGAVVPVEFFDNAELLGDKVTTATSDENGKVYIYGLAYGTYYVVETKAPAGYNLLGEPAEIIINEISHTAEKVITVENTAGAILPETGGMGTHVFFAAGIVLVCAAGLLFFVKKCKTC